MSAAIHESNAPTKRPYKRKALPETPTALLIEIDRKNPSFSREERRDEFVEKIMLPKHQNLLIMLIESMFPLLDSKIHPVKAKLTTEQKAEKVRQKLERERKSEAILARAQKKGALHFMKVGYLNFPMPNGKTLGECKIGEARKMAPQIGGLMNLISNLKGGARKLVGDVYSEAQLQKLASA